MRRLLRSAARAAALAGLLAAAGGAAAAEPSPSPAPRLVLAGVGTSLRPPQPGDRNDIFGYFTSIVRDAAVTVCPANAQLALVRGLLSECPRPGDGPVRPQGGAFDFVESAIPLDGARYDASRSAFARRAGVAAPPVQVPYVASTVAFLFDNPDVSGPLRLAIPTLCAIADGEITNWNAVPVDPTNPSGATYPTRPLRFVVRRETNDETFALANFLSSRTPGGAPACDRPGETFALQSTYGDVLPHPLPARASERDFLYAAGDAGAAACIAGASGACASAGSFGEPRAATGGAGTIGYLDPVDAFAAAIRRPLGVADLYVVRDGIGRDENPIADLPGAATHLKTYVLDRVLAPYVRNGRPPRELVALPPFGSRHGCVAVIPPADYAFPAVGYPIVVVTNLVFAQTGNGDKANALRTLATLTNDGKNVTWRKIRTIDGDGVARGTRGFSVLPLPTDRKAGLPSVAACIRP